eukprot:GHVL01014650.1.p1 GENE.GHVL01014650.1~~GHVL01014650.1.p1  ORF type:complete len:306 (+),score=86.56 GHVL01014650.1:35-919(+)
MEATMVCVDNSEWMRNGDFHPTRFQAQTDAANIIFESKLKQHPESAVGLLSVAGDRVDVRMTLTNNEGQVMNALNAIKISNAPADFVKGIQTAQMALKHRQQKMQRQRIVCFIGSPLVASEKQLEFVAKNSKKNNVAIDIVSFGSVVENSAKLKIFINAAMSNGNCHLVEVEASGDSLFDVVRCSPICNAGMGEGGVGGPSAGADNPFGVDPTADPALYEALRMSLEEEQARQKAAAKTKEEPKTETTESSAPAATDDLQDESFVRQLLSSVEGVDMEDPDIQKAMKRPKEEEK